MFGDLKWMASTYLGKFLKELAQDMTGNHQHKTRKNWLSRHLRFWEIAFAIGFDDFDQIISLSLSIFSVGAFYLYFLPFSLSLRSHRFVFLLSLSLLSLHLNGGRTRFLSPPIFVKSGEKTVLQFFVEFLVGSFIFIVKFEGMEAKFRGIGATLYIGRDGS